ncbi:MULTISPECIES: DUF6799 domain-containing protein [Sphingobacterium]|uniref:DUF6799 domain-containing protein n=1 Tax=Sphingobacterium TaxID=28453 RepID=UPI0013DD6CFE|nr:MULTISPECIES: DUF6799 domain-containing protein [unclassified Sphingobacterium]
MKKLVLSVALISWIGFSASAQEQKKEHNKEKHHMQKEHSMQHWCWKDGKIMEMKDGKSMQLTKETKVGDVWIRPNGEVVMKDKKVVQLKADQYLDHTGAIHQMMKPKEMKMPPSKK